MPIHGEKKSVPTAATMAPPPPLQPTVTVAIYRALLRSCRNGRTPEVFGPVAATAWANVSTLLHDGCNLPNSPAAVRASIRDMFDRPLDDIVSHGIEMPPPFEVLRMANSRSQTLLPNAATLPTKLPIFDFEHSALLPGEETSFRFFEPRYKRLVEAATGDGGDGWFLLRMRLPYYSILVRIIEHVQLPNGDYAVNVAAGPRVSVLVEDGEAVTAGAPRLAWAMEYELKGDDVPEDDENAAAVDYGIPKQYGDLHGMRQRCMDLLLDATTTSNMASISMPPLDPEPFSFWALRFVLGDSDVSTRIKWLACRSTSRRLLYVIELLESFAESRSIAATSDDRGHRQ